MRLGYYVRCPLYNEAADYTYPRCFMLAQLQEYNEISEEYTVLPHDLLRTAQYYLAENRSMVYPKDKLERCAGSIGGNIRCAKGNGIILAHSEPINDDEPYLYYIKLSTGEFDVISELDLEIEYTQMDYSPLKQIKNYEFQNPTWFANRIHVGRNVNFINNASYGFRTMAGCRAYMLPHQVSTVARCFEMTPVRYVLADEVGLGKTIEACSIVKIMASDNTALRALFVVPGALVNQWKNELVYKFSYANELDRGQSLVIALEDFIEWKASHRFVTWDVLVIDETHRLLANRALYDALLEASKETENVLLLSATPIQDRKDEYHRLLTLLSPEQYENMPKDRFSQLVKKQKRIQKSVNIILKRMESFEDYEEDILESIDSIAESLEDPQLDKMVAKLGTLEDKIEQVEAIISYICENYRLERRVIRNRRGAIATEMPQRTLAEIHYLPCTADDLYDENEAVEATMRYLSEQDEDDDEFVTDVAQPLLSSLFSSPWAFEAMVGRLGITDDNLVACAQRWKKQAVQEVKQIDYILDEDPDAIHSRIMRIIDYIEQETDVYDKGFKLVVFTSFTETLHVLKQALDHRFEGHNLTTVAFAQDMSRDDLETSVYEFQNNDDCRIILCDETGGEGRNFQNAKMIIHIDLPWSANALEQRIGRLDRLGRDPEEDVLSVAIYTENTIEEQLLKVWRDGMQLFTHSLSGMEIITGELNNLISEALMDDYYNGLANALPDIMEIMEDMRDAVEDEQQFDVGATIYRPLSRAVEDMLKIYLDGEGDVFARSMLSWSHQAGLCPDSHKVDRLIQFSNSSFESRAALQSLFAPPDWSNYDNASIVRKYNVIRGTFSRRMAIEREDLLFFAPSDPVYEAIASNAMGCSRGRCCAVTIPDSFKYMGMVFTFTVQPNIKMLIEQGCSPKILSQFRIFLPLKPITVCVPLTKGSMAIPDKKVLELLDQPWKVRNGIHLGQRSGLGNGTSRLQQFMDQYPEDMWHHHVENAFRVAKKNALEALKDCSDLPGARREISRLISGRRAECAYFGKDEQETEKEVDMYKSAWEAIKSSTLVLDSVCFLKVIENG